MRRYQRSLALTSIPSKILRDTNTGCAQAIVIMSGISVLTHTNMGRGLVDFPLALLPFRPSADHLQLTREANPLAQICNQVSQSLDACREQDEAIIFEKSALPIPAFIEVEIKTSPTRRSSGGDLRPRKNAFRTSQMVSDVCFAHTTVSNIPQQLVEEGG